MAHNTQQAASSNFIGQKLKLEMKKRGISSAELSKRSDVKTSFIYDVISGKSTNPSTVKLARVAESLDIDLNFLVGNNEADAHEKRYHGKDYIAVPRIDIDTLSGKEKITSVYEEAEYYYFRKSWIENHLKTQPENLRMLYISGDSMEPTLLHNDIVLVDTSKKTPSPPGVFVLFDGLGLSGKRLEYVSSQKTLRIMSDNSQYSSYERSVDDTIIVGRIVWFAREM